MCCKQTVCGGFALPQCTLAGQAGDHYHSGGAGGSSLVTAKASKLIIQQPSLSSSSAAMNVNWVFATLSLCDSISLRLCLC